MRTLRELKDSIRKNIRKSSLNFTKIYVIDELSIVTQEIFLDYATKGIPFIFRHGAKDWPLSTGGIDLFVKQYGDNHIKVRYGNYSRGNTKFKIKDMLVKDYVASLDAESIKVPEYAGYQITPDDISEYIDYPNWLPTNHISNPFHLWLGPKGTYTALHSDTPDKLIYQSYGSKRWYLIAPQHADNLYIDADFGRGYDTSPIDPRFRNDNKYSLFDRNNIIELDLNSGDVLFLPGGWYHAIESLSKSLSFEYKSDPIPLSISDSNLKESLLNEFIKIKGCQNEY